MALLELQYRINSYYVDAAQARLEDLGCLGMSIEDEAEFAGTLEELKQKDLTIVDQVQDFAVDFLQAHAVLTAYFEVETAPELWAEKLYASLLSLAAVFGEEGQPPFELTQISCKPVDQESCLLAYTESLAPFQLTNYCTVVPLTSKPNFTDAAYEQYLADHKQQTRDTAVLEAAGQERNSLQVQAAGSAAESAAVIMPLENTPATGLLVETATSVAPFTLELYTGQAFGTGEHASTMLAANLLEAIFVSQAAGSSLLTARRFILGSELATALDLGCGSGILTLLLGRYLPAYYKLQAWDIEEEACANTFANYLYNLQPENLSTKEQQTSTLQVPKLEVACQALILPPQANTTCRLYPNTETAFSFMVANLLADLHIASAWHYRTLLETGGIALLSGIYRNKRYAVEEAMSQASFKLLAALAEGEWEAQLWQKLP